MLFRYKNIEDANAREELFNDFIQELEKKERLDHQLKRDNAITKFNMYLESLAANKSINYKSGNHTTKCIHHSK